MKKALVLTNHLWGISGSEVSALEVIEEMVSLGYVVTVGTNLLSKGYRDYFEGLHVRAFDDCKHIDLAAFDFVWAQHLVAPLCKNFGGIASETGKYFSVHLSPYESLELIGLDFLPSATHAVIANSFETRSRILDLLGRSTPVLNFFNAAPRRFRVTHQHRTSANGLKRLLIVSNHLPSELVEAIEIVRSQGRTVDVYGVDGRYRRVRPEDIANADAVVTIGKTAQYAILGRAPVYCYDQFGGPGWLTTKNVFEAKRFNFSGRCCGRRLTSREIAHELLGNFEEALVMADLIFDEHYCDFDLTSFLLGLTNEAFPALDSAVCRTSPLSGDLADLLRTFYRASKLGV